MGSNWKSNSVTLYPHILDWLCGELLGDGCLYHPKGGVSAKFQYSSKYMEYTWYVAKTLDSYGIRQSGKICKRISKSDLVEKECTTYQYQSLSYIELQILYNLWYPEGKKIVPEGLGLPPVTCRQWYMGDGSLVHSRLKRPCINMSTQTFPVEGVNWLVSQLVALGFKASRQPNSNSIYISPYSVGDFLDYIGECPVGCYKYKWDLDNEITLEHLFKRMEEYSNV